MTQRPSQYGLSGGLDEITPALGVPKGRVIACKNHESTSTGYARVGGFERYDGQQSPTDAFTLAPSGLQIVRREAARAAIQAVPGAGPVRGVATFRSVRYAWRDNTDHTKGIMYRATPAGWVVVSDAFPAGGRYLTETSNFYGASSLKQLYGCNGVGKGFAFDGTVVTFISTGMTDDRPLRIAVFKKQLFFAFAGGSVQHSQIGEPTMWSAVVGAGEIAVGSDVSDLLAGTDALFIFTQDSVSYLSGSDETDFTLTTLVDDDGHGAVPFTAATIGKPMYFDVAGMRAISATQEYGNFRLGSVTAQIQPTISSKVKAGVVPVAAVVTKGKDQYRLFYSDGTGISMYFGRKYAEPMLFDMPRIVQCACVEIDLVGGERTFIGADDGFVYELDVGSSYDGVEIEAYLQLPWDNEGSADVLKRWHKFTLEMDATPETSIGLFAEFDYGDGQQGSLPQQPFTVSGGGGVWDAVSWDTFYWSSAAEGRAEAYFDGQGENMSVVIVSKSAEEMPYTLSAVRKKFSVRGQKR
jgi:hypothetical protein